MIDLEVGPAGLLVVGALMLFWVGMLGLLWRRSLIGMLVGLLFAWISVALAGIGFSALRGTSDARALGAALVLCSAVLGGLQIAVGLGIVIARIKRRGTLDADDAALLEG
ncbi:MAG: NADH-quinone oxidoreductase subunit K [Myxococcota bacterium]